MNRGRYWDRIDARHLDGRPKVDADGRDELLERLIEQHGEAGRPDLAPEIKQEAK